MRVEELQSILNRADPKAEVEVAVFYDRSGQFDHTLPVFNYCISYRTEEKVGPVYLDVLDRRFVG